MVNFDIDCKYSIISTTEQVLEIVYAKHMIWIPKEFLGKSVRCLVAQERKIFKKYF